MTSASGQDGVIGTRFAFCHETTENLGKYMKQYGHDIGHEAVKDSDP